MENRPASTWDAGEAELPEGLSHGPADGAHRHASEETAVAGLSAVVDEDNLLYQ